MIRNGYFKAFLLFTAFLGLYIANFFLPFSQLYPFAEIDPLAAYDTRSWNWTVFALFIMAIYFILKYRKFHRKYLLFALLLGLSSGIGKFIWLAGNPLLFLKDLVEIATIFYSGCLIYEVVPPLRDKINLPYIKIIKSFGFGVVLALPFAILNAFYFSLSAPINLSNFFLIFIQAFQPALAEEIPFRFFLLGILYYFLKGKVSDIFFTFFSYFMLVVPHSLIHLPSLFIEAPTNALVMLLITSLIFGLPMAILMVKKNLATAVGFHWLIDFLRFFLGFG